jgi:hypothetical protein
MASAFDDRAISYALEKIGDFIRNSGSGASLEWSDAATKVIVDNLRAFEKKLRARHVPEDECAYHMGSAIYAACELQSFVAGDKSDIANKSAATVYRVFLAAKITELRQWEQALDEPSK